MTDPRPEPERSSADAYWRANRNLILILLSIWALVSYGFSILLAEPLAERKVGALPASFWWAQQGAMIVFVLLIFVYAKRMDKIDRDHGMSEDE